MPEIQDYLNAVQCLRDTPSRLGLDHSLYDNFPWIRSHAGSNAHNAAASLLWHRCFIQTYERALREDCGYKGHLSYWDWPLEWKDITKSPIWNSKPGFGGNGNLGSEVINSLGIGHCVEDVPFAMLLVPYLSANHVPHCLSRDFNTSGESERLNLRPQALDELLDIGNYE